MTATGTPALGLAIQKTRIGGISTFDIPLSSNDSRDTTKLVGRGGVCGGVGSHGGSGGNTTQPLEIPPPNAYLCSVLPPLPTFFTLLSPPTFNTVRYFAGKEQKKRGGRCAGVS